MRDFARIDIKTNKEGKCFFLEANLVPGMTEDFSYFPKACELSDNMVYTNVVELMLENAISRINNKISLDINAFDIPSLSLDESLICPIPIDNSYLSKIV